MPKQYLAILAVALSVLSGVITDRCAAAKRNAVADQLQTATDSLRVARIRSQIDSIAIVELRESTAKRDTQIAIRQKLVPALAAVVRATPVAELPDTCKTAVVARDSLLSLARADNRDLATSLAEQQHAVVLLERDVRNWKQTADYADSAATEAAALLRHPPGRSVLPRLGVGGFAGVCSDGRPCIGAGLTFGWHL